MNFDQKSFSFSFFFYVFHFYLFIYLYNIFNINKVIPHLFSEVLPLFFFFLNLNTHINVWFCVCVFVRAQTRPSKTVRATTTFLWETWSIRWVFSFFFFFCTIFCWIFVSSFGGGGRGGSSLPVCVWHTQSKCSSLTPQWTIWGIFVHQRSETVCHWLCLQYVVVTVCLKAGMETTAWTRVSALRPSHFPSDPNQPTARYELRLVSKGQQVEGNGWGGDAIRLPMFFPGTFYMGQYQQWE